MSLTGVKMSEEVWLTCLTHSLSTETEEIMGLLLGDIQYSSNGNATALIWGASPQTRSDRRKDRVETNPEQLAAASHQAERMTLTTGITTRVIGWYHSHPHITVLPSHVDVRTQAMYQLLDTGFIGLIFSCFSEDAQKVGRIQVIAFQSLDGKQKHMSRPVPISPVTNSSIIEVESSWSSSENVLSTSGSARGESFEQDTGDSRATSKATKIGRKTIYLSSLKGKPLESYVLQRYCFIIEGQTIGRLCSAMGGGKSSDLEEFFSHADVNYSGREKRGDSKNPIVDVDPMDMSASMQEAMHRSNLDMSGAEYVRKEIPLQVLPTRSLLKLDSPLTSFTQLQQVLFEEERAAYNQATLENTRDGKAHPLAFIHHTSTYQASMCKLMEYCLSPAINALQDRLKENEIRLAMMMEEAKILEAEAFGKGNESSLESPRHFPSHGYRGSFASGQRDPHASAENASIRSASGIGSRSRKAS